MCLVLTSSPLNGRQPCSWKCGNLYGDDALQLAGSALYGLHMPYRACMPGIDQGTRAAQRSYKNTCPLTRTRNPDNDLMSHVTRPIKAKRARYNVASERFAGAQSA